MVIIMAEMLSMAKMALMVKMAITHKIIIKYSPELKYFKYFFNQIKVKKLLADNYSLLSKMQLQASQAFLLRSDHFHIPAGPVGVK